MCMNMCNVHVHMCICTILRVGAQLGLAQMITTEIKIPNRLVGLGKWILDMCKMRIAIYCNYNNSVIGRQGEMINKLQLESNAKIQVAPG